MLVSKGMEITLKGNNRSGGLWKMMPDREKVIDGLERLRFFNQRAGRELWQDKPYDVQEIDIANADAVYADALALLKEQDELLRKLQKDKDRLCLEVSNWKHKFHDAPPTFVSQAVVEQIRWERDTALTQLDEIDKGLGSKMDDIVALLKGQEPIKPKRKVRHGETCQYQHWCGDCMVMLHGKPKFCPNCGRAVKWE